MLLLLLSLSYFLYAFFIFTTSVSLSYFGVEEDEGCPVWGAGFVLWEIGGVFFLEEALGGKEAGALALAGGEVAVEFGHELLRGAVCHLPQAHHYALHACLLEAALKSHHALATDVAKTGLASREHGKVAATEVET